MRLKRNCIFFNAKTNEIGGTPDWEHTLGQANPLYLMREPGCSEIINGLVYNSVDQSQFLYGTGGDNYQVELVSIFKNVTIKIYNYENDTISNVDLSSPIIVILVKQIQGTHSGRRMLKFSKSFTYDDVSNENLYNEINTYITNPWFGYELKYDNEISGKLFLTILNDSIRTPISIQPDIRYISKSERKLFWDEIVNKYVQNFEKSSTKEIKVKERFTLDISINKIYFGPPGTGKSYAIKEYLNKNNVSAENYSRVTFHPDYDYHSFVGGYKPFTDSKDDDKIKYKFVPQIFTELYVKAWTNQDENYFLVIEEINRGNCSEIFGDIFQLLDRNPEYNIEPSTELREYLSIEEGKINVERIENGELAISLLINGKLEMPSNLSILASMNTSDQSLYPMDSAFKRRWEWEYIPIDTECKKSNFTIEIKKDKKYSWLDFIGKVNSKIYSVTKSEDKQIGNWFIDASKSKNIISKEIFINKVLFYLWNDVFKDETYNQDNIFVQKNDDGTKIKDLSFNDFHKNENQDDLLTHLFEKVLGVIKAEDKAIEPKTYPEQENTMSIAAEPSNDDNDSE